MLLVTSVAGFEFFVGPLLRLIGLAQEEMVRAKWTRLFLPGECFSSWAVTKVAKWG